MMMTDTVREQLSALLDGELPDNETELLLKRLDRDPDLRLTLSRYSLIGAALRTDGQIPAARAVAARVSAAVAQEPALSLAAPRRWTQLAVGLSVAASVAVLAVTFSAVPAPLPALTAAQPVVESTVATMGAGQPVVLAPMASAPVPLNEPVHSYTTPPASGAHGRRGADDPQLARYMIAHAEYATPLMRRSLVSSLVAAESRPVPVLTGARE